MEREDPEGEADKYRGLPISTRPSGEALPRKEHEQTKRISTTPTKENECRHGGGPVSERQQTTKDNNVDKRS